MNKKIKVATLFSGIGAFEDMLKQKGVQHDVVLASDNGGIELPLSKEEIELLVKDLAYDKKIEKIKKLYESTNKKNYVKESYLANYEPFSFVEDVRFIDGSQYKNIDILVGGSPCQSFSISGKRLGLNDARGTLFYEYARILKEMQPKVFIYENVTGLLSHDEGRTFEVVKAVFDEVGYKWSYSIFNAKDHGIPQDRRRFIAVGVRQDLGVEIEIGKQVKKHKLDKKTKDFLLPLSEIDNKYFHGEKGFLWVTKPESLKKRVSIDSEISRTQTANQQFNWCGDMVSVSKIPKRIEEDKRIFKSDFRNERVAIRKMHPRECLNLMGFSKEFKIAVPDKEMYHQSGNSIVTNVLGSIFEVVAKEMKWKK